MRPSLLLADHLLAGITSRVAGHQCSVPAGLLAPRTQGIILNMLNQLE